MKTRIVDSLKAAETEVEQDFRFVTGDLRLRRIGQGFSFEF